MKSLSSGYITPDVTNDTFRLLGRKHSVSVLRWLSDHKEGSILHDIDYEMVKSQASARNIMLALVEAGWVHRDEEKRYHLTEDGGAALDLAKSERAIWHGPEEM